MASLPPQITGQRLKVAGLFAGIGGIELGLHRAGHETKMLCEVDAGAARVLETRFKGVDLSRDVRELTSAGRVDLLTAGFPCQDLSQAGRTKGIEGRNSGLVGHVFRLLDAAGKRGPAWLLLENVSFMLHLEQGKAMRYLIDELEARGYTWAYRVVDTRAFGLPQRRQRVILLASKTEDPRGVLLAEDSREPEPPTQKGLWCGFYWTEGIRGLGWAIDAVPTLKGGSTIGIASPPAIWNPRTGLIATPDLRDAERLQGFTPDWTLPALEPEGVRRGHRWKLVGNAVSVPVAHWVGERLACTKPGLPVECPMHNGGWPKAAWGHKGKVHAADASMWPVQWPREHLSNFFTFPLVPLSARAAQGFFDRTQRGNLKFDPRFLDAVVAHAERMKRALVA